MPSCGGLPTRPVCADCQSARRLGNLPYTLSMNLRRQLRRHPSVCIQKLQHRGSVRVDLKHDTIAALLVFQPQNHRAIAHAAEISPLRVTAMRCDKLLVFSFLLLRSEEHTSELQSLRHLV